MRRYHALLLPLLAACLALARGDGDDRVCADASALLPFATKQIKQGTSLVVFQGAAAPQVCGSRVGLLCRLPDSHTLAVRVRRRRLERAHAGP